MGVGVRASRVAMAVVLAGAIAGPPAEAASSTGLLARVPDSGAGDLGFAPARLRAVAQEARRADSTCFAVTRRDRLAGEWNWRGVGADTPREVFSVTKSVTSALVGIAVRDGDLRLGDRVSRYVPAWRGTASARVTVRQLLSNDSGRFWSAQSDYVALTQARNRTAYAVGLPQQHRPGSAWAYNNAAIQVLDRVLRAATGMRTDRFAQRRLFTPLGMDHTRMTRDAGGRSTNVYFGLQTTCRDLLRFGSLYLHQGRVDGQRLLGRSFARRSVQTSTRHNAAYGLLWWLNRPGPLRGPLDEVDDQGRPVHPVRGRIAPGAPARLYAAQGFGGQIVMVDPGTRTVVVRLGPGTLASDSSYGLAQAARVVTYALR